MFRVNGFAPVPNLSARGGDTTNIIEHVQPYATISPRANTGDGSDCSPSPARGRKVSQKNPQWHITGVP